MKHYLFNTEKIHYVKGKKPDVPCILCAMRDGHSEIEDLTVARTDMCIVCLNLYPYNPGHLMVFPRRHIEDIRELTDDEGLAMHRMLKTCVDHLIAEFGPAGFNLGYNLGEGSGASIPHIHHHIVPRYRNEVGFLEVLAETRVIVVDPRDALVRLRKRFMQ